MKDVKPLPVLMTALVSTRGMKKAFFSDEERERMYVETLNYYIKSLLANENQSIVFAENSGWDMEHLKGQLNEYDPNRLIFISLSPELFDISKGKGYNELLMMNMAIRESPVIQDAVGFVKVTGRYPIFNLSYFVEKATDALALGKVLYCDIKDHKIYDWLRLGWEGHSFFSLLYGVRNDYYWQHIAPKYTELNDYDGHLVEGMLYNLMVEENALGRYKWRGETGGGRVSARFKREPICGGLQGSRISAWSFSADQNDWKSQVKRFAGNCIRCLTPWFWF